MSLKHPLRNNSRRFASFRHTTFHHKILIGPFLLLTLLFPYFSCSHSADHRSPSIHIQEQVVELRGSTLLPLGTTKITDPQKILCGKNGCFILDGDQKTVHIYKLDGCSMVIETSDNNEAQLSKITSFARTNDKIFVYCGQGQIEVFDYNGTYDNSIILELPKTSGEVTDICVGNDFIYAAFSYGEAIVKRFNPAGAFVDDFITGGQIPTPPTIFLANLMDIYLIPSKNLFALFNKTNGAVEIYDTNTKKRLRTIEAYDPITLKRADLIKQSINSPTRENNDFRILTVTIMRSTIIPGQSKLIAIPSQKTAKRENWRHYFYSIDLISGSVVKKKFKYIDQQTRYPMIYCLTDKSIFFIDDEKKIYHGGLK